MKESQRNHQIVKTGCRLKSTADPKHRGCGLRLRGVCPLATVEFYKYLPLPWPGSMADQIAIPLAVRKMPVSNFTMSVRLQNILGWKECRVMGDLDGLRFSELARWRNCGKRTLLELVGIIRCLQHANWNAHLMPYAWKMAGDGDYVV
jgi:hypothetical protein